jgi:hypothetical protein
MGRTLGPWGAVASVSIVLILVSGGVILAALGKDVSIILTLTALVGTPVLVALGVSMQQTLGEVKDQVNGNNRANMELVKELQETVKNLALRVPTPPDQGNGPGNSGGMVH